MREVVSQAKYMVLGLGDVYLGAPCAVPVDPRSATVPCCFRDDADVLEADEL